MVVYALLIAHLLADFYFQPSSLANGKLKKLPLALLHFAIYTVTLVIPLMLFTAPDQIWKALLIIAGSHCLIDSVRILIEKNTKQKYPILLFVTDQALHILIILCVYWFLLQSTTVHTSSFVSRNCLIDFTAVQNALLYVLIVLFALLPEAIFVKKLLQSHPQKEQPKLNSHKRARSIHKALVQTMGSHRDDIAVRSYVKKATTLPVPSHKQDQNMGLIIGMLERVLVVVFILVGQYSSIAFVIAAKSIARFKQLEDQAFAEKYLIGTLSSVALAMLTTALLSNFFIVNP